MYKAVCLLAGIWLCVAIMGAPVPVWALGAAYEELSAPFASLSSVSETTVEFSDWLEPRGLNIVDLVGWVPESDLVGAIIQGTPGYGILRYVSGSRIGNTVTITATAYPRFYTSPGWNGSLFGCLGQGARIDELGSVAPATKLHVYAPNGQEITWQVDGYYYVPTGLIKPIRNPNESESANLYRYWETDWLATNIADGAVLLPVNMGCELLISNQDYSELTLVFEAEVAPAVSVTVLGRQDFQFPVYFGPGYVGHLSALRDQLAGACTTTPPVVADMVIPSGTDYFLFNFPPTPADPYTAFPTNPLGNVDRPTGATYRLRTACGLSVDHVVSLGLPLNSIWIDMDQAPNTEYLPYASQAVSFEGLESLLPAGISYDPCMVYGNCPAAKLAQICNTAVPARMIYLRVDRIQRGLSRIPLRMPGPAWSAASATAGPEAAPGTATLTDSPVSVAHAAAAAPAATPVPLRYKIYLANVAKGYSLVEPDDSAGCSINGGCGWFTSDGRMVDYISMP